jgi:hypothetical protein
VVAPAVVLGLAAEVEEPLVVAVDVAAVAEEGRRTTAAVEEWVAFIIACSSFFV